MEAIDRVDGNRLVGATILKSRTRQNFWPRQPEFPH